MGVGGGPLLSWAPPAGLLSAFRPFPWCLTPVPHLGSFGEVFCLFSFFIQMGSGGLLGDCLCVARCLNFLSLSFFAAFSTFLT